MPLNFIKSSAIYSNNTEIPLTSPQRKLQRRFLAYQFFMNLWFIEAIWLYFYRMFMNDAQVGLIGSLALVIGLITEIPSGALADKFGRNRMVRIGMIIAALGLGLQAIGGFWPIIIFQIGAIIGFSLVSGADEALFFEKLKFRKNSLHWRRLIMRYSQMAYLALIVAVPIGGFLYEINPILPFILTSIAMLISTAIVWNVRDEPSSQTKSKVKISSKEFRDYFASIKDGLRIFTGKKLRIYVPIILAVQGLLYFFDQGLLTIAFMDRFHFSESFGGIVIGAASLFAVVALHFMHKYAAKLGEKLVITALSLLIIASLVMAIFDIRMFGIFVILILYSGDGIIYPFISEVINKHTSNSSRSTVLSTASVLRMLPYILLAPLVGWLNTCGELWIFLTATSILIVMAWAYYVSRKRRDAEKMY